MTLAERFIEINKWPMSRKLLAWCVVLFFNHVVVFLQTHFFVSTRPAFDGELLSAYLFVWLLAIAIPGLLIVPFAIKGVEARWTGYFLFVPYIFFTIGIIYLWGTNSNPNTALIPFSIFVAILFFGVRPGIVFFCLLSGLWGLVIVLELNGVIPYAPLVLDRSVDVFANFSVSITYYVLYVALAGGVLAICVWVVKARDLQETRLQQANGQLARSSELIRRYVPAQVADAILSGHSEAVDEHTRRKLTIFFSDIVGFTDISEQMEPEDLSKVLNEYFSAMTAIAQRYDGTVDELTGDAILVFFGAPQVTNDKDHALRAVRMAMEMQATIDALNAKWRAAGVDAVFKLRMGISTGVATIGNFGSEGRTKYAALGRSVNLAARLQSQAEPGRILLSHPTWLLVQDQVPCVAKGELQLKGFQKPVQAYELLPPAPGVA